MAPNEYQSGNRSSRREKLAFGRSTGGVLHTTCIAADASLYGHPHGRVIADAAADLRAKRSNTCICCRGIFPACEAGAYLAAVNPRRPTSAAISSICATCWQLPIEDISDAAERAFRAVLPQGRFIDALPEHEKPAQPFRPDG